MEKWETFLDNYPISPDLRSFGKALQHAGAVLKEDLAPFEIEWIIQTVLYKPIHLLTTLQSHHTLEPWYHCTGEAYKLLTDTVGRHGEVIEPYFQDIDAICTLPLDPTSRKHALSCLTSIAVMSPIPADSLRRHIVRLSEGGSTTERVLLIGAICQHHPESAADLVTDIWRTFLNLMDSKKNTDKLNSALLQAVDGLFKHFGCDLPTTEVNAFYDKMVAQYLKTRCEDVCLKIISTHSNLFVERLSRDTATRAHLWDVLRTVTVGNATRDRVAVRSAIGAVRSAYEAVFKVDRDKMESIISNELVPRIQSPITQIKYTALRLLTLAHHQHPAMLHTDRLDGLVDMNALEFELRSGSVSYDIAEAIAWCIESHLPNCDNLLQTAILFSDHLPVARRKEIVIYGILNAPHELRNTAVTFLTNETVQTFDDSSKEKYYHIWLSLFDNDKGKDNTVVEKCSYVFDVFVTYARSVLECFLEEDFESPPPVIVNLLALISYVFALQTKDDHVTDLVSILTPFLLDIATLCECAEAVRALTRARVLLDDDFHLDFKELINLNRCRDESTLCAKCEFIIESELTDVNVDDRTVMTKTDINVSHVVSACLVVFGRNDVEFPLMCKALKILEYHVLSGNVGRRDLSQITSQLESQRVRSLSGKEARIFRKDLLLFLAKHDSKRCNVGIDDRVYKLTDLILTLPDHREGVTQKVNLKEMLRLSIESEHPETLQTMLTLICANLSTTPSLTQYALPRTLLAVSRAYSRCPQTSDVAAMTAVRFGNAECVGEIITYITCERSPGVRKMLSDALETVLMDDHSGKLLAIVVERVGGMLSEERSKRAGLDVAESVLTALKESNAHTKKSLPRILELISKTDEPEADSCFELGSKVFMEKIELFDNQETDVLLKNLIAAIIEEKKESKMADASVTKSYKKTVKSVVKFVKNVNEYKKEDTSKPLMIFFEVFDSSKCDFTKVLYVLSEMHNIFELSLDMSRKVLSYNDYSIHNELFCIELRDNNFCTEAVLKFMKEYSVVLLELQYQKTLEHLGNIIIVLTPPCVIQIYKTLKTTLLTYKEVLKTLPRVLLRSLEEWCQKLHLSDITVSIEKEQFTENHATNVKALKRMLSAFDLSNLTSSLTAVSGHCQKWPQIILKLFSKGYDVVESPWGYVDKYLKAKLTYLVDILTVSVQFLQLTDVKKLLLEGHDLVNVSNEKVGLRFCRYFMAALCSKLTEKPFVLLEAEMAPLSILLCDIVKYLSWKKAEQEQRVIVLQLVEKLWTTFVSNSTFEQQHAVLFKMNNSCWPSLAADSKPLLWAVDRIQNGGKEEKARLVGVLPGGEPFRQAYMSLAMCIPARLCELSTETQPMLRAIIDALAATGDKNLMDTVAALAGDETKGWWDTALDSCMASLASRSDLSLLLSSYRRCFQGLSLGVTLRILLPLLRYSTSSTCETFYSSILTNVLAKFHSPGHAVGFKQMQRLADCSRAFVILQMAFEKLPPQSLESPSSALYSKLPPQRPWHLARKVCTIAGQLRSEQCPVDSSTVIKEMYRKFHCANYNCISAATCRWRPSVVLFAQLFDVAVWRSLVNDEICALPLVSTRARRTKLRPVSIEVQSDTPTSLTSYGTMTSRGTLMQTPRTKLFLRTLSENPLQFDLIADDEEIKTQELNLVETALNSHECAVTLTALFKGFDIVSGHTTVVATALTGSDVNVRLLVAQTICNSKDELKPLASELRPALLAFVSDTAVKNNGRATLHQLHIDVIETLTIWPEDNPEPSLKDQRDAVLSLLLTTCMENGHRPGVFNTLSNALTKWLDLYGSVSTVGWKVFEPYLDDNYNITKKTLFKIIGKVVKAKIYLPELVPIILTKLDNREDTTQMSELFGLAVSCQSGGDSCRTVTSALSKFRRLLEEVKVRSPAEYVKMVYYGQMGCGKICDERHFKMVIDQVKKLAGAEKSKCFKILTSYISENLHEECVTDMFATLDFCEIIAGDDLTDVRNAIEVVTAGFEVLDETLKRRIVNVVAEKCSHNDSALRAAACEFVLIALKDLLNSPLEPPAKRARTESSRLLRLLSAPEVRYDPLLRAVVVAVTVQKGLAAQLLSTELTMRYKECFALTVELPISMSTNKNTDIDLSVCTATFLELLFSDLRSRDSFRNVKLRDEPLEDGPAINSHLPTKLLSRAGTYQGTFSKQAVTRRNVVHNEHKSIDVTVSIDDVLDKILRFAKINTEAACALIAQLAVTLCVSGFVPATCIQASPLAPLVLMLATHEGVCDTNGLTQAVNTLKEKTNGSDSAWIVQYLYREVLLDGCDEVIFHLGRIFETTTDVCIENTEFLLEDLTCSFGQLSSWDRLTVRQKNHLLETGVPPLWTTKEQFKTSLDTLRNADSLGWFPKLVQAYRRDEKQDALKWLREMDVWPRRHFHVSAIAEAVEWQWNTDLNSLYSNDIDIQDDDCMAEWAARLMVRSEYFDTVSVSMSETDALRNSKLSRSHELQWCMRANEMGLHSLVIDCVKRNSPELYESETLSWLNVQVSAIRAKGKMRGDEEMLQKGLIDAEKYLPQFLESSSDTDVLAMNKLILELHTDLNSLSKEKLQSSLKACKNMYKGNLSSIDAKAKRTMLDICQISMAFYHGTWDDTEQKHQETLLNDMLEVVEKATKIGADSRVTNILIDVIMDKLEYIKHELSEDIAIDILDCIKTQMETVNEFSLQQLKAHASLFPSHLLTQYSYMSEREEETLAKYKRCFQAICDAEHTLMHYCGSLQKALKERDEREWTKSFERMKEIVFENPFSGSDYLLLNKYKDSLYNIGAFDPSESYATSAEEVLNTVVKSLAASTSKAKTTLKLSQLCPSLTRDVERDGDILGKLLGISGVKIVGFDEQLQVFTASVRRPVALIVRTSAGRWRRFLLKLGDDLVRDAAALHVAGVAEELGCCRSQRYKVTPLGEDCGLIEFLEHHQRLRDIIAQQCDIDAPRRSNPPRPIDHQLILSRPRAMCHHEGLTAIMPARALRRVIREACLAQQSDLVAESAASCAIIGWILGLGDRHLENILCSPTGGLCCVDWAAILQYGVGELPPARLTRNIIAACDADELESRLQTSLQKLRSWKNLLLPTIRVAFRGMGIQFQDKYAYINSILEGKATSYHITKDAVVNSNLKHKFKYAELLDEVFIDVPTKEVYSVEEQVTVMLRQCTDPRILSITRSGWEPWL